MDYDPLPFHGREGEQLRPTELYLLEELQRLAGVLRTDNHYTVQLDKLSVEPIKPRDGMVVLADGVNFNPGSGPGYYGFRDGLWRFLG